MQLEIELNCLTDPDGEHYAPPDVIPVFPMQLWLIHKVHSLEVMMTVRVNKFSFF